MSKQVIGVYETAEEAVVTVENLRSRGYSKQDITLAANENVRQTIPYGYEDNIEDADAASDTQEQSFWDRIKDAFTFEDSGNDNMDSEDHPLAGYEDQIERGSIAVLVDSDEEIDLDNPDYVGTERDDTVAQGRANDPATGATGHDDSASGNIADESDAGAVGSDMDPDSERDLTEDERI